MPDVLMQVIEQIGTGRIKVVDLTQPLHPGTPVINLPEPFAASLKIVTVETSFVNPRSTCKGSQLSSESSSAMQ